MAALTPNAEASNTGAWTAQSSTTYADVQAVIGIFGNTALATERIIFELSSIAGVLQATAIPITLVYTGTDLVAAGGQQLKAILRSGGSDIATVAATVLGVGEDRQNATLSGTFSGLTLTQAQLDALQLVIQITGAGGGDSEWVVGQLAMAGVTYTPSAVPQSRMGLGLGLGM